MRSLTSISAIAAALIAVSLAFGANGAVAAEMHAKPNAKARVFATHAAVHVAARHGYPVSGYGVPWPQANAAQIVGGLLGSPWLKRFVAQYAGKAVHVTRGSSGGTDQFDYSTPEPSPPPDTSIQDMLNRQIQQQADDEVNAINQMNATIAADAAQRAADDAAMTQQIMNNGGL